MAIISARTADTYTLTAVTNGHEADNKSVTVGVGAVSTVILSSRGIANLTVHTIDFVTKQPIAGARCTTPLPGDGFHLGPVFGSPGEDQTTDATGTTHFQDITAGQIWMLCQITSTFGLGQAVLQANANASADVYFVIPRSGGGEIGVIRIASHGMTPCCRMPRKPA